VFIHAAFQPPPPGDEAADAALAAFAANERMAAHASEAALRLGAKRVVLLTSGSVYPPQDGPVSESTPAYPVGTAPPYPRSCLRIEETFVRALNGVPLVIARLFHPYGPRQLAPRLIPRLAERIGHGQEIVLRPGRGEAGRPRINPVYVDDAAEALHLLATAPDLAAGSRIVNIGGPDVVTIRELALLIARHLGTTCRFRENPAAPEALDLYTAVDTLVELTGFRPSVPLDTGLPAALRSRA
jgi:GDP-L-fucose synthase